MTLPTSTAPARGETKETPQQKALATFEMLDARTRKERARRSLWVSGQEVNYQMMWNAAETAQVMSEARDCFVNGSFLAVLTLALAYAEHTLIDALPVQLTRKGKVKPVMLSDAVEMAKAQQLFPAALLDRVASLVSNRNPYVHRRPADEPDTLAMRANARKVQPKTVTELDAQEAIRVMHEFLQIRLYGTVDHTAP